VSYYNLLVVPFFRYSISNLNGVADPHRNFFAINLQKNRSFKYFFFIGDYSWPSRIQIRKTVQKEQSTTLSNFVRKNTLAIGLLPDMKKCGDLRDMRRRARHPHSPLFTFLYVSSTFSNKKILTKIFQRKRLLKMDRMRILHLNGPAPRLAHTEVGMRLIYSSKITGAFLHQKVGGFLRVQLIDFILNCRHNRYHYVIR
jgi:hypothetical protein